MSGVTEALHEHHKFCDEQFAAAEQAVQRSDWCGGQQRVSAFAEALQSHFGAEEDLLFPAFEARTGMSQGPTQVMRFEHGQMRDLLRQMADAVTQQDADGFGGAAETLLILMQQHNMKEENILYPMCEQALAGDAALASGIAGRLSAEVS